MIRATSTLALLLPLVFAGACASKSSHSMAPAGEMAESVALGGSTEMPVSASYEADADGAMAGGEMAPSDMAAGDMAGAAAPAPAPASSPVTTSAVATGAKAKRAERDAEAAPIAAVADDASIAVADEPVIAPEIAPAPAPQPIAAARLTAGTFDDALNPGVLAAFAARVGNRDGLGELAAALATPPTIVTVVDPQGRPVAGVKVAGKLSGTDGRVILAQDDIRTIRGGGGMVSVHRGIHRQREAVEIGASDNIIRVPYSAGAPQALDLALVIDATGSMGDELEYIKSELQGIVGEIAAAYPNVDQRWALVVYRDRGDEYVTRTFDFTEHLGTFQANLSQQYAGGGGDYPEAMDRALADAARLSWRGGETARVTFLIADAPPHARAVGRTMAAIDDLGERGVGIYPIAASGVADEAELVMRSAALTTGGKYLFLTDDSGIGNSHAEPHIPCYDVESLRDAMVRMVQSELAGRDLETEPRRLVRKVGQGSGGVCRAPAIAAG